MQMNRRMAELLTSRVVESAKKVELHRDLAKIIEEGFSKVDGVVVFKATHRLAASADIDSFPDLTGYECFANHLHIEDYLTDGHNVDQEEKLLQGVGFCFCLESALKKFSIDNFRIIISFDGDSCNVRFHKVRPGETWLVDDLESYKEEALVVLNTSEIKTNYE